MNTQPYTRSPNSGSTKLCDESRQHMQHICKVTKNKTLDYRIKCKTYSSIPKQCVIWLVLLNPPPQKKQNPKPPKTTQHILSDTERVFLKSLSRFFRSNHYIITFSIFLGTPLENQGITKHRQILKSFKNKYA